LKIQLTVNQPEMHGYLWASPFNESLKNPQEFFNCWEYCMDGQCTELYGPTILDIFTVGELEIIIPKWAKLIAGNGKMILGGIDFYIMAKEGLRRAKDIGTINEILFSKSYGVQSITSIESTRKFMESLEFKINNICLDYENFNYTVEGIKNAQNS